VTRSIGYLYGIGSHTRLQRWRLDVFVVRVQHTSLTCVFQLRLLLVVPSYALLVTANLSRRRRSFRSAAPTVWNSLPHHIRQSDVSRGQFASRLKIWLFSCVYTWEALLRIFIVAAPYKTTD